MKLWLNVLRPTRLEMLTEGPTERERHIVDDHFQYWQAPVAKGTALLGGRTQEASVHTLGIVLFEAADQSTAVALCQGDPTVRDGVMVSTVQPYRIALLADRVHWLTHAPT